MVDYLTEVKQRGLNTAQMTEVKEGLKTLTTDQVDTYAQPDYDNLQMQEIRLGLEHGLTADQMAIYANPSIPWEAMNHSRIKIENADVIDARAKTKLHALRLRNVCIAMLIVLLLGCSTAGIVVGKRYYDFLQQDLTLDLSNEEVTLDYGQGFNPMDYVTDYTQAEDVQLKLPDAIDTKVLGTTSVIYTISNPVKSEQKELKVRVVDQKAPMITLSNQEVTLTRGQDKFACKAYLTSAVDDVDGDLTQQVQCSKEDENKNEQDITYSVTDAAGNGAEAHLSLKLKDPPPPPEPEKIVIYRDNKPSASSGTVPAQAPPQTHGSQSFMFADGYNMDSGYQACIVAGSQHGAYTCQPIQSDGIYTGYQLKY